MFCSLVWKRGVAVPLAIYLRYTSYLIEMRR